MVEEKEKKKTNFTVEERFAERLTSVLGMGEWERRADTKGVGARNDCYTVSRRLVWKHNSCV